MITVTAVQTVKPGMEPELDELMQDLIDKIKENEPGCVRFDYVRADDDGNTRLVYEQYRDPIAFEYHKTTPYLQEFIPKLLRCLEGFPEVRTYGDVLAPIVPPSFFHVGMVVPDLDAAVARYSDVLGMEFTEPAVFDVPRLEDPDPHPFKLTAVFSRSEPPYYELIQAEGDGICSVAHAGKILYYGVWEPDMAGRLDTLRAQGVGLDALFRADADAVPFAMITAPDLLGARIEYVGVDSMGPIEEWVRTGVYPGGIGG
ncbi:antibiotic biosynthesis monooxygenase [Spongiactinospora sp. TRM90649]|uniref:antibiotic biosynthesis monooxygenase n=1 Tax=Spongiactinospora sp. TRM90649 TaxID=3031114 RepID=UPI0023FA010F|nr:antibiotic biosynthesis monooxygenase [Spongiactinospora sp. TRM90649]MDF5756956.1 VOC family protein [Spongiactinospora sp. TRM90649]